MSSSCSDAPPANHRRRRRDHNVVAGLDTQHYIRGRSRTWWCNFAMRTEALAINQGSSEIQHLIIWNYIDAGQALMSECGQAEDRGGGWSNVLVVGVALNFEQLRLSLALLSLLLLLFCCVMDPFYKLVMSLFIALKHNNRSGVTLPKRQRPIMSCSSPTHTHTPSVWHAHYWISKHHPPADRQDASCQNNVINQEREWDGVNEDGMISETT